ncbi:hypothetical protein [Burkholderia cepacia]|uniref:hypothetical protein n=1 Tax=Burkholderia cepacia TaxID=292 RepID=UPI00398E7436
MATPQAERHDGRRGAHLWLNAGVDGARRFPSLPEDLIMMDGFNHQLVVIVPRGHHTAGRDGGPQLGHRTFRRRRDGEPARLHWPDNHDRCEVSES